MQLYVDESGNLGKSGKFFVIACLCPQNPKRIKNIIKRRCVRFGETGSPLEEIKGCNLDTSQKQDILNRFMVVDDFSCSYVVADKKFIEPKLFQDKNICYNYLASHLFKRIVKTANEDIEVIMDNHTIKVGSLNSLEDYIRIEAFTKWGFTHNIRFEYQDSKNCRNLQAVDLLSNTIYAKYMFGARHLYGLIERSIKHKIHFPYENFNK